MQLHLVKWCAMTVCMHVCVSVYESKKEREKGREREGIDLTGVFRDEVQRTACQLDGKSVFCVCACMCVCVGEWVCVCDM